jgi:hypothetical protein
VQAHGFNQAPPRGCGSKSGRAPGGVFTMGCWDWGVGYKLVPEILYQANGSSPPRSKRYMNQKRFRRQLCPWRGWPAHRRGSWAPWRWQRCDVCPAGLDSNILKVSGCCSFTVRWGVGGQGTLAMVSISMLAGAHVAHQRLPRRSPQAQPSGPLLVGVRKHGLELASSSGRTGSRTGRAL